MGGSDQSSQHTAGASNERNENRRGPQRPRDSLEPLLLPPGLPGRGLPADFQAWPVLWEPRRAGQPALPAEPDSGALFRAGFVLTAGFGARRLTQL